MPPANEICIKMDIFRCSRKINKNKLFHKTPACDLLEGVLPTIWLQRFKYYSYKSRIVCWLAPFCAFTHAEPSFNQLLHQGSWSGDTHLSTPSACPLCGPGVSRRRFHKLDIVKMLLLCHTRTHAFCPSLWDSTYTRLYPRRERSNTHMYECAGVAWALFGHAEVDSHAFLCLLCSGCSGSV